MRRWAAVPAILGTFSCGPAPGNGGVYSSAAPRAAVGELQGTERATATASAARDIPCDPGRVVLAAELISERATDVIVVEGCGQRLTYLCAERCLLTSRVALPSPGGS